MIVATKKRMPMAMVSIQMFFYRLQVGLENVTLSMK